MSGLPSFPSAGLQYSTGNESAFRAAVEQAMQQLAAKPKGFGTTAQRPKKPTTGDTWFDTTLGYPIWWSGTQWVDATGVAA